MVGQRRQNGARADDDENRSERMRKPTAGEHFLARHDDRESCHPDNVHHADREHQKHHRPAAAEAVGTLLEPEPEYTDLRSRPVGKKEREGLLAPHQTCVLECRELVNADRYKDCTGKQPVHRPHS